MTKIPHVGKYEFKLVAIKNQQNHLIIPTRTRKISKTYRQHSQNLNTPMRGFYEGFLCYLICFLKEDNDKIPKLISKVNPNLSNGGFSSILFVDETSAPLPWFIPHLYRPLFLPLNRSSFSLQPSSSLLVISLTNSSLIY